MAFERKYSDETRNEAVSRVHQRRLDEPDNRGIVKAVAAELSIGEQSLRSWVNAADGKVGSKKSRVVVPDSEVESGTADADELAALRLQVQRQDQEILQLTQDNEALRRASAIFAAQLLGK